jgi:hypothetical protein
MSTRRAAGVGVVPPCAAYRGRPLQDDEIGHARLPQPDARAEPAETGADDGGADMTWHGQIIPSARKWPAQRMRHAALRVCTHSGILC